MMIIIVMISHPGPGSVATSRDGSHTTLSRQCHCQACQAHCQGQWPSARPIARHGGAAAFQRHWPVTAE